LAGCASRPFIRGARRLQQLLIGISAMLFGDRHENGRVLVPDKEHQEFLLESCRWRCEHRRVQQNGVQGGGFRILEIRDSTMRWPNLRARLTMARPLAIPGRSNRLYSGALGMALGADDRRFGRRSAVMGERTDFRDRVTTTAADERGKPAHPPGSAGGKR
jgi:hypothetical protein